jgi:hypothetical protein
VQIITPSLNWSITLASLQALRNLIFAALVASSTRLRTATMLRPIAAAARGGRIAHQ